MSFDVVVRYAYVTHEAMLLTLNDNQRRCWTLR
jgi:hypothetical protein